MALGQPLSVALINDSLRQTGQSIGHAVVMLDQATDRLKPLVASDFTTIGFSGTDPADLVALMNSWNRLLRFIRGQDAAPIGSENFMIDVKKLVGVNY